MNRAIVRHVRWHVHATGTWKPPLAPEGDCYTEGEEEDRVSDCHPTSCLYTVLWGTNTPTDGRAKRAHKSLWHYAVNKGVLCVHPSIIGSLPTTPV